MRFRNRMGNRNELDVEWPDIDAAAGGDDRDRNFRRIALGGALGLKQCCTEPGCINRALQFWPEIDDGAKMVLMSMRQHEADKISAFLLQKADIWHDRLDARQMFLVAKGHAEIDG